MCSVQDVPPGLPKDPNPRAQRIDRAIWRDIKRHLLNQEGTPNSFHLKNKGITLIASTVEKLTDEKYRLVFDEGEGIVDGGHTYELILDNLDELATLNEGDELQVNQFVKLEVLTGLPIELATEIAGGLNTAVQVQTFSLENLKGKFEWVKGILKGKPYYDQFAFRENEKNRFDARDIVVLLDLFNIRSFPNDSSEHPIRAYSSKAQVLDHYVDHTEEYEILSDVLPDILTLHDTISVQARDLHNQTGGKAGKLAFVESRKRGAYHFPFIGKEGKYQLSRGALYPMLAAFRWMLAPDEKTGKVAWIDGFDAVLELWESVGGELMRATQSSSEELGRKTNAIGRSKNHWANLHNIVAKRHLMTKQ